MNLDQVTIEIRPRRPWEAIDLGLLMARRWWRPLMQIWLLLTLPLFALLNLLPSQWLWLGPLLLWWLKPLFERPLLHILSQAVFNQLPDSRSSLRAFRRLAGFQLIHSLTWRRLSPSRSMDLPVIQLEGLQGAPRKERLALLHREDASPAAPLTIIGFHLELALACGLLMLLYALVPSEIEIDWLGLFRAGDEVWFTRLINGCSYVAMSLVAPFYVACGFALYLNRRIKLEAWDIDIAFRRIHNKRRATSASALLILPLILALGFLPAPDAAATAVNADETASQATEPYDRATAKTSIKTILAGDDFHQQQVLRYPVLKFDNDRPDLWDRLFEHFPSLKALSNLPIARIFEIMFWVAVLALIGILVVRYRHWLATFLPRGSARSSAQPRPSTLFGLDLARGSLPDDISASALHLWRSHEHRAALALLYRASLSRLLEAGLEIEDSHTEGECLTLLQAHKHPLVGQPSMLYFARLTQAWQRLAYGHLLPSNQEAEQLCVTWNEAWNQDWNDTWQTASTAAREHDHG